MLKNVVCIVYFMSLLHCAAHELIDCRKEPCMFCSEYEYNILNVLVSVVCDYRGPTAVDRLGRLD